MKAGMVAVALLAMLACGSALASADDGNELLVYCKQAVHALDTPHMANAPSDVRIGQCFGIMEGVKGTMALMEQGPKAERVACWPDGGITNGQAARIVVKYLDNNPAKLNKDGVLLTVLAFSDAYPCK